MTVGDMEHTAAVIEYAVRLADAIDEALPEWVERSVRSRLPEPDERVVEAIRAAGAAARADIGGAVRELVLTDIDEQRGNPLAILRDAVRYPTGVLLAAGVPAVDRDGFSVQRFPEDHYDLTPASWSDFGEAVLEAGIAWGAAKAFTHKQRHGR
jgi:hypothetical protein